MYEKIMIPLDGSELAECVMPHLDALLDDSKEMIKEVVLIAVVKPLISYNSQYYIDPEIVKESESAKVASAREYLDRIAENFKDKAQRIRTEILVGPVTELLIDYAEENSIDLVIIATHGRSGVTRWVMGSVADKILKSINAPVLMIRSPDDAKSE